MLDNLKRVILEPNIAALAPVLDVAGVAAARNSSSVADFDAAVYGGACHALRRRPGEERDTWGGERERGRDMMIGKGTDQLGGRGRRGIQSVHGEEREREKRKDNIACGLWRKRGRMRMKGVGIGARCHNNAPSNPE